MVASLIVLFLTERPEAAFLYYWLLPTSY